MMNTQNPCITEGNVDITVVIPVWNDPVGLARLLDQIGELGIFSEAIVVDDASSEVIDIEAARAALSRSGTRLNYIAVPEQHGAGHARNLGLKHVTTSHVLFFDSDDLFGEDIGAIVDQMKAVLAPPAQSGEEASDDAAAVPVKPIDFDFCIFRHHDSRNDLAERRGPLDSDERRWQKAGITATPSLLSDKQMVALVSLAAYPWNKIYRTSFLRDNGIRCTEIMVHNDIELHWTSFLVARTVLATNAIGAVHFFSTEGARLTNRRDADRLHVVNAWEGVFQRTKQSKRGILFLDSFLDFYVKLVDWIEANMDDEHTNSLARLVSRQLLQYLSVREMRLIAYNNPRLAGQINKTIMRGWE